LPRHLTTEKKERLVKHRRSIGTQGDKRPIQPIRSKGSEKGTRCQRTGRAPLKRKGSVRETNTKVRFDSEAHKKRGRKIDTDIRSRTDLGGGGVRGRDLRLLIR